MAAFARDVDGIAAGSLEDVMAVTQRLVDGVLDVAAELKRVGT